MLDVLTLVIAAACAGDARAPQGAIEASTDAAEESALLRDVVRGHAAWCHSIYAESARTAHEVARAAQALVAAPSQATLDAARAAWIAARRVYGQTEALRFCDGPIESVEPALNAWPIDEAYIDAVAGRPDCGIVNDLRHFPRIGETVIALANERGGETNVSLGWHAIEFLLWGQDLDPSGPGRRPFEDFVANAGRNATRRGEYLIATTQLLARQLDGLASEWAPDAANYRRAFEAESRDALRKILTGAIVLTAFELNGERLGVAYETQDQEQEHSCFSDTSHQDFVANQLGITTIFSGERDGRRFGPGVLACVRSKDAKVADDVQAKLAATTSAFRAIPMPFDRAMVGADDAPGRVAIRAALTALEAQTDALAIAGRVLGFQLPLEPGG